MPFLTSGVFRKLFSDAFFSILASIALKALPFVSGSLLLRFLGDAGLAAQNSYYVLLTLFTTIATGGLGPFLLYHFSKENTSGDHREIDSLWTASILIYHFSFAAALAIVYTTTPTGNLWSILLSAYFATSLFFVLIRENGLKNYRRVFGVSSVWSIAILALLAGFSWAGFAAINSVTASYGIASFMATTWLLATQSRAQVSWRPHMSKSSFWSLAGYTATQILTVGSIFYALAYVRGNHDHSSFNNIIFCYQLYTLIVFLPGLLANVTIPHAATSKLGTSKHGSANRTWFTYLPVLYAGFGTLSFAAIAIFLPLLVRLYGLTSFDYSWDNYLILATAIPSSIIAGANQLSIARNDAIQPALIAVVVTCIFFASFAMTQISLHFGLTLFCAMSVAAALNALIHMRKQSQTPAMKRSPT